jgi:hypothetical protein
VDLSQEDPNPNQQRCAQNPAHARISTIRQAAKRSRPQVEQRLGELYPAQQQRW